MRNFSIDQTFDVSLQPRDPYLFYPWAKRLFDLLVALPAAILTLPAVIVLCVASSISFRSWPLFIQERVGRHQRPFRFVKIRSLPIDTPNDVDKYALRHICNTRFGNFIRRTHLDELPQLWLVVLGTMSLVGPRPEMPSLARSFEADFSRTRSSVRPGCTGFWQVSEVAPGLIGEHPEYDIFYVRFACLRFDLWILIHTVRVMLAPNRARCAQPPVWLLRGAVRLRSPQVTRVDLVADSHLEVARSRPDSSCDDALSSIRRSRAADRNEEQPVVSTSSPPAN